MVAVARFWQQWRRKHQQGPGERLDGLEFTQYSQAAGEKEVAQRLADAIPNRRSTRRFQGPALPRAQLERLLQAAVLAPSAHNRQPWRFVVLESPAVRRTLAVGMAAMYERDLVQAEMPPEQARHKAQQSIERIQRAPAAILLCVDEAVLDDYPDSQRHQAELVMAIQSVAMAGENLLLAAQAAGLAGVWLCAPLFAPHVVRSVLNLPADWLPQGLVLVGHPAEPAPARALQPLEEFVRFYD